MARSKNGFFSNPNGKIGPVVFYELNGQFVCRSIGAQRPPTTKQLANQQRMAVTMKALVPMLDFIQIGLAGKAKGTTNNAFNLATSHTKKHALQGEYPNIAIDYSQVMLSSGSLPGAENISVTKTDKGVLVNWGAKTTDRYMGGDDLVMIAMYHPLQELARVHKNAARRDDGSCFIPMECEQWHNEPIEVYLCFRSADGEKVSDSSYAGNLNGTVETSTGKRQREKYEEVNTHFQKIEASYLKQQRLHLELGLKTKAYRHLEREYKVLKLKLDNLPGKPD